MSIRRSNEKRLLFAHLVHSWYFTEILEEIVLHKEVYEFLVFSMRSHFLSFSSFFFSFRHFFLFLLSFFIDSNLQHFLFFMVFSAFMKIYHWVGFCKFLLFSITSINFSFLFLTWIPLFKLNISFFRFYKNILFIRY